MSNAPEPSPATDFIRERIRADLKSGKYDGRVHTRFPPEPNGHLHIGHAKAIVLNFEVADEFGGLCNLRMDDTNPRTEEAAYVEAIQEDIRWLGYDWGDRMFYASDYFDQLYDWALELVRKGLAYVDDQGLEEVRRGRGTPSQRGVDSPHRNRTVEENLDLLERMRRGEFDEGSRVLRAKIDMGHKNLLMRDPVLYRIKKAGHHRTGDKWCIYPTYDYAHGQSDSIEGITHSLCTLEFENHRPLYDWLLEALEIYRPQQIEFARLNLTYTVMSKRKLLRLVDEGRVSGWDDPRVPTLRGMRRRGYTPRAIISFCRHIGVAKYNSQHEVQLLEHFLRQDLNKTSRRVMAVLDPLKVVIENYPEAQEEELDAVNNPEAEAAGTRKVPFSREIFIERQDFMEDPPGKFFRLAPGREVRLRYAYFVTCTGVVKDDAGNVTELRCTYDPDTRGGDAPDGRKVKGTIHWVSAEAGLEAEIRLYDLLFSDPEPDAHEDRDFSEFLNPDSLKVVRGVVEPSVQNAEPGTRYQFERMGYFCVDPDSSAGNPVFNRTVTLKDSWAKTRKRG